MKKKGRKKKLDKETRQMLYVLVGMVMLLGSIFFVYSYIQSTKTFEYKGLIFKKTKDGQLDIYVSKISQILPSGEKIRYNLRLMHDPRELHLTDFPIRFRKDNYTFISIDQSIVGCREGLAAITNLGLFLSQIGVEIKGALTNPEEAEKNNAPYITCENTKNATIFILTEGNETKITKKEDCYTVEIANCEVYKAVDSVMLSTIISSKLSLFV